MGLFGENANEGNVSAENPLGIEQAQEQPGQPANGEEFEGENQSQQTNLEELAQQADGKHPVNQQKSTDYDRKVDYVREKFKSAEEFEKSINELEQKLGVTEQKQISNPEEAINYYMELEQRLGQTSNVDQTRQQLSRLEQENQRLRQMYLMQQQQAMQNPQNMQQPRRDPQTGRFVSQQQVNNQQNFNQQQQQPQQPQENTGLTLDDVMADLNFDVSADEAINELYEKGYNSDVFKKVVAETSLKTAEKLVEQKFNEMQQQQQQQEQFKQQKMQQAQQLNTNYHSQVDQIKQKYGEDTFEQHKDDVLNFFKQYPMYLDPQMFPNGFEIAFNNVRTMNNQYQQQQQNMQQAQQYNNAQKQAARIPQSQHNNKLRFQNNMSPEEEIRQNIFHTNDKRQGIFG
jgi:hypothetical protein